jgi:uncharacterized membrane protein
MTFMEFWFMENRTKDYKLWHFALVYLCMANVAYVSHSLFGWLLTLSYFGLIPGYLILKLVNFKLSFKWEIFSFSFGLSLLFMIVSGLALNCAHAFGLNKPLTTLHIFIFLDLLNIVLLITQKNTNISFNKHFSHLSNKKIGLLIILTILPLIGIGGATRLNNGASDILTMILFLLIAAVFAFLYLNNDTESLYPYAVIMIAMSVLFTVSLRGSYVIGHDIQREFYVFELTKAHSYWNIGSYRNPYNACLSITILPTVISRLTSIPDIYIYKGVFQIFFACGIVSLYLLVKRIINAKTALLSAFIFISFPTFLNDITFLNRQEIAFIFFSLLMLTSFIPKLRKRKLVLTILFLVGLILSHYSSSYVTLALLLVSSIFYKIITMRKNKNGSDKRNHTTKIPLLRVSIICIAILATFLWNTQITTTSGGLKQTVSASVSGLLDHSSAESSDVGYSLLAPHTRTPSQLLDAKAGNSNTGRVIYTAGPSVPITGLGKIVSHIINVSELNNLLRQFCAKILQILLIIGIVVLIIRLKKQNNPQNVTILALSLGFVVLLVMQTVLPQLSIDYGTLRFFQQALVVLSIPIIAAAEYLTSFFRSYSKYILLAFFLFLFLDLTGFLPQLIGSYTPQLALNNQGIYYDLYYVHKGEVLSANWTLSNSPSRSVTMDQDAQIRFLAPIIQGRIKPNSPFVNSNNYFYLDYANTHYGRFEVTLNDNPVEYIYTSNIFANLNTLYVNQDSRIYR